MLKFSSILLALLLISGCNNNSHTKNSHTNKTTHKASDKFILQDINNQKHTFTKKENGLILKNSSKIIIIDIFATWCPPCQAEAKVLADLQKKYPQKLQVFGISIEKNIPVEKLQEFQTDHNANYTLLASDQNSQNLITYITSNVLHKTANIPIPFVVMYKDGKLLHYYVGATEEEFIQSDIESALKGK